MKNALLLVLAQTWALTSLAQLQTPKSSLRLGIDLIKIDAPDETGLRYQLRYAKHLFNDRLLLGASFGYFNKNGQQNLYQDVYVEGHKRCRLTGDISILADLLASPKYSLRLGGGPSLWYRQDNLWSRINYDIDANGNVNNLQIERYTIDELNIGYHLTLEYEQLLGKQIALSGRLGWADLRQASISVQAGLGISYLLY